MGAGMSLHSISAKHAEKMAREFLQQQYSMMEVVKSFLEDEGRVWSVEVLTTSYNDKKMITECKC